MTEPQAPYTTKEPDKILSVYNAVIVLKDASCNPAALFDADGSADRFAWMNAIQRGYVEIQRVFEIEDTPANGHMDPAALLSYKVTGTPKVVAAPPPPDPDPSLSVRLAECEDAICGLYAADEELSARVDAAGRQHAVLVERVMDNGSVKTLRELVHNLDARLHALEDAAGRESCRDCVWVERSGE